MILAIPVINKEINSEIDDRFGRGEFFLIYNLENEEIKYIENIYKDEVTGAGQKVVKMLYEIGVEYLITPELGPKAKEALKGFGMEVYKRGNVESAKEGIDLFKSGKLEKDNLENNGILRKA